MNMGQQMLQFAENSPQTEPWIRVGTGFSTKKGNGFNLIIGNQVPKERGSKEMVETVKQLTLKPGDGLYLGVATNKDGEVVKTKNGATVYRLSLKPREDAPAEEAPASEEKSA